MKGVCFVTPAATFQGWLLGGSVHPRTQCSLLGVEITAWLSELPLLPRVAKLPKLFFCLAKNFYM